MNRPIRIAVVDDEPIVCRRLSQHFKKHDFDVETFAEGRSVLARMRENPFDIVLLDIRLPGMDGMEVLKEIKKDHPSTEVIMITGYASIESSVEAVKLGAFYYIPKPFTPSRVMLIVEKAIDKMELVSENRRLRDEIHRTHRFDEIVGISRAMDAVLKSVAKVANVDCNVLLQGESGTGKELIARAVHFNSNRRDKPFISFNCGGFAEDLIANELFGHEKGAFTGAHTTKIGLLEAADTGTLFLDEIGEMPASMQVKLLRVIQERKLLRLGSTTPIELDIRIISATNSELEKEVESRNFRNDLYYRLKVVLIKIPPLRERKEDIAVLLHHFMKKYNKAFKKNLQGFVNSAMDILIRYSYPGNVRELENIVSGAVALAEGD